MLFEELPVIVDRPDVGAGLGQYGGGGVRHGRGGTLLEHAPDGLIGRRTQRPHLRARRFDVGARVAAGEFGDADRPAEPSARPAFDTASERAVRAAGDVLAKAAEGVAR